MRKPCCEKQDTNKGAWSKQEDQKLRDYIQNHGEGCWRTLPRAAGLLRCGKSCRLRWINYLRPDLKRGNFADDEKDLIIKLHALLGNRWSLIAGRLPGRTDNEVKNYWNSHLRRKLVSMEIDTSNYKGSRSNNINLTVQPQVSGVVASSGKRQADQRPKPHGGGGGGDNDQLSDARSCLEDDSNGLPDLNLELAISISAPSMTDVGEEQQIHKMENKVCRELEFVANSPTLSLFT